MLIDPLSSKDETFRRLLESGHARLHFSQLGEDAVILHLLDGKRNGFYVDIGCHHPLRFSNTAILCDFFDWTGVNVDADESLIAEFEVSRPRDRSICACVGAERGEQQFNVFFEPAVNTADAAHAEQMTKSFRLKERRIVQVYPLSEILNNNVPSGREIDFLSVDVEGLDIAVLQSNDWTRYRPKIIAVETHGLNDLSLVADHPSHILLKDQGYRMTSHLVVTSIYERE